MLFQYKVDNLYNKNEEGVLGTMIPESTIDWEIKKNP